ncbi:electron transfer flavoprotein subunit beta/FixA family protein, partial [Streptomyces sp. NPDC002476]|uniref:electron transfer flavoprotein subunit beta/FixA family protein n=1 Tax=Streptomyces sp. NPDC002476 TaxID=3364648 RepID=UPI0036B8D0E3
ADRAVHVEDESVHGSDVMGTSLVVARAVEKAGFDLVIGGMASTDGGGGVVPALLAERLGVPQVTLLSEVSVEGGVVRGRRDGDVASEWLEASLPAVVSVTDQSGEARYPSFKGIMAAKKKPVESWDLDDLGVEAGEVGLGGAFTQVVSVAERPARSVGTVVTDEGEGGRRVAEFLAGRKFI